MHVCAQVHAILNSQGGTNEATFELEGEACIYLKADYARQREE